MLTDDLLLKPAVTEKCLSPFKSLFKGGESFRRYSSPKDNTTLLPGFSVDAIRLDRAGTDGSAKPVRKFKSEPIDGGQHLSDGGYEDEFNALRGTIRGRSDYVSRL